MAALRKVSVTGLGYVGLTIAITFAQKQKVIGFDIDESRLNELKKHHDRYHEISADQLKTADITYSSNPKSLEEADFHIVAVLTPVDEQHLPDFTILLNASNMVGQHLKKGDIVVYEATVYPGVTEEICIPALEKASGLTCGKDFFLGYSPERINPGDKVHTFENITKIVSATDPGTLEIIGKVYQTVLKKPVYPVSCIRVAEATKIIENTQRDINISLINEVSLVLHSLGMDSSEVLAAAKTKWNFIPATPGLVGGHCIGINSYYLAYKAEQAGFYPMLILDGRRVNDMMGKFIAEQTIKKLIHQGVQIKGARIAVLGMTYKENYPDVHDNKVIDVIKELQSYEVDLFVHDPLADSTVVKNEYDIHLTKWDELTQLDAIILTVAHQYYLDKSIVEFKKLLTQSGLVMDVKSRFNKQDFSDTDITLWRL